MAETVHLQLPYLSMVETGTNSGITCLTALLRALGDPTAGFSVGERDFNVPNPRALQAVALEKGMKLSHRTRLSANAIRDALRDHRPVILLVAYSALPHRFDPSCSMPHYILVHGMEREDFLYDDPFHTSGRLGGGIRISPDALESALWASTDPSQPLAQGLVLRSHWLKSVTIGASDGDKSRATTAPGVILRGVVRDGVGKAIVNASVRLIGTQSLLGGTVGVLPAPAPDTVWWDQPLRGVEGDITHIWQTYAKPLMGLDAFRIEVVQRNPHLQESNLRFRAGQEYLLPRRAYLLAWTCPMKNISGNRFNAYFTYIDDTVLGIDEPTFRLAVLEQNPHLDRALPVFQPTQNYRFPENLWGGIELFWTRSQTGLNGTRDDIYQALIRGKVAGFGKPDHFYKEVVRLNPTLASDDNFVFQPQKSYRLPENKVGPLYYLNAWTDANGAFTFAAVPHGLYTLEVIAAGAEAHRERLLVEGATTHTIQLKGAIPIPDGAAGGAPVGDNVGGGSLVIPKEFVQMRDRQLWRNHKPFRFIGMNIRGIVHYGRGDQEGGDKLVPKSHLDHRVAFLSAASAIGVKVVRCFVASRFVDTNTVIHRLAEFLELLGKDGRDMVAILALTDIHKGTHFHPRGDTGFFTAPEDRLSVEWYNQQYQDHYLTFAKTLATRFKDNPRVMAWQLGNELKPASHGGLDPEAFIRFAHAASTAIKKAAPKQLVTTGIINCGSLGMNEEQAERLYKHRALDFLTIHAYDGLPADYPKRAENLEFQLKELGRMGQEQRIAARVGKPYVIEEFGVWSDDRRPMLDNYLRIWVEGGIEKAAGFIQWGFMPGDDDIEDGDTVFGMDHRGNFKHPPDYQALADLYSHWARNV